MPHDQKLLIVTGLSGAGMSSALKALEDIGYEVLDNFPLDLLDNLVASKSSKPIALGIDTRTRNFSAAKLKKAVKQHKASLLFITCKQSVLVKRFTETRRKHPLAKDRPIQDGLMKEEMILAPVKAEADHVIDTTELSIHDLRRLIEGQYNIDSKRKLTVSLISFGFRNGIPRHADLVMDVRFLKNPHWEKKLKEKTGQDKAVGQFIQSDESFAPFLTNFTTMLEPLLERYTHEGKSYLTIAIGCTGGKHRSVFTVEELAKWFKDLKMKPNITHRDMPQ